MIKKKECNDSDRFWLKEEKYYPLLILKSTRVSLFIFSQTSYNIHFLSVATAYLISLSFLPSLIGDLLLFLLIEILI